MSPWNNESPTATPFGRPAERGLPSGGPAMVGGTLLPSGGRYGDAYVGLPDPTYAAPSDVVPFHEVNGISVYHRPSASPLADENLRLYEAASSAQREWADQGAEDIEFTYGAHWSAEQAVAQLERGHMPMSINITYQLVSQAVSMLTANRPAFQAVAREDGDAEGAALRSLILAWIWEQSNGQLLAKRTFFDYYVTGRGVLYVYADPHSDNGRGDVRVMSLSPFDVYPDPASVDPLWDDARFVIVRRVMTAAQIREIWPDADLVGAAESSLDWPYGPTGKSYTLGQQLFPNQVATLDAGMHEGDRRYEVIERLERVRRPYWRVTDPMTKRTEAISDQEMAALRDAPAFLVTTGTPAKAQVTAVYDPKAVQALAMQVDEFGPVWHLEATTDPMTGQPTGEQVPVAGPEPIAEDGGAAVGPEGPVQGQVGLVVPESTVRVEYATVGGLIDLGVIPTKRFLKVVVRSVGSVGGVLLYQPFDYPTQYYPVVPFLNNHARTAYTISDVRLVRDLQLGIDKINSLLIAHLATSAGPKVFVPKGGIEDVEAMRQEWSKAGPGFIEYDTDFAQLTGSSTGGIVISGPTMVSGENYAMIDRYKAQMEQTLGILPSMQGQVEQRIDSYKATLHTDEAGLRRIKSKLDDLYAGLERVGRVALDLVPHVYTEEKVLDLVQPDGEVVRQGINVVQYDDYSGATTRLFDVTRGSYDAIVRAGSTLPSNRWALLEAYMGLYERGIVDQMAVLKKAEVPDAQAILERSGQIQQMQQMIASLQEQVKSLQGDMQTKDRELMHARQAAEMERFKSQLRDADGDIRKAVQVHQQTLSQEEKAHRVQLAAIRQVQQARQSTSPPSP